MRFQVAEDFYDGMMLFGAKIVMSPKREPYLQFAGSGLTRKLVPWFITVCEAHGIDTEFVGDNGHGLLYKAGPLVFSDRSRERWTEGFVEDVSLDESLLACLMCAPLCTHPLDKPVKIKRKMTCAAAGNLVDQLMALGFSAEIDGDYAVVLDPAERPKLETAVTRWVPRAVWQYDADRGGSLGPSENAKRSLMTSAPPGPTRSTCSSE